jgi:hypothetical protein
MWGGINTLAKEGQVMPKLREFRRDILMTGRVDTVQLTALRERLYSDGKIDRTEADFLAEMHKRVQRPNPGFDRLFYGAIKDHILADGGINAEEAAWLRRVLFADGKLPDEARKFLHELKGEARETCPDFEALYCEAMKQPAEQHTCGG